MTTWAWKICFLYFPRLYNFPLLIFHPIKPSEISTADMYTLCSLDHFAPWNTLHPNSLCLSTHFTPWHTLLISTLYFLKTLCYKCCGVQSMLRRKSYQGAKCYMEQSVPRSRVFQEAKCAGEQSVSGSKVFQRSKCVEDQNVLRSKVWVCKVCQGAKCSGEQSLCQPIEDMAK